MLDGTTEVVSGLQDWLSHPFSTQMSAAKWAAFTGLILVFSVMWILILRDLKGEI